MLDGKHYDKMPLYYNTKHKKRRRRPLTDPRNILNKKSWNVYNKDNQAKIARDEAEERAWDEAQTKVLQEYEAAKKLAILQGKTPPPRPKDPTEDEKREWKKRARPEDPGESYGDNLKRRKLPGEDETDRDIRLAREAREQREQKRDHHGHKKTTIDAPIIGEDGHINLFPMDAETMRKLAQDKKREEENTRKSTMLNMHFDDAAGRHGFKNKPWYTDNKPGLLSNSNHIARSLPANTAPPPQKSGPVIEKEGELMDTYRPNDRWGHPDPARKQREIARLHAMDPLNLIKNGLEKSRGPDEIELYHQQKARERAMEAEQQKAKDKERQKSKSERKREKRERKRTERSKTETKYARRAAEKANNANHGDDDGLDGFSLDPPAMKDEKKRDDEGHRRRKDGKSRSHHRNDDDDDHHHHRHVRHHDRSRSRSPPRSSDRHEPRDRHERHESHEQRNPRYDRD